MEIKQTILKFFDEIPSDPHHRYLSWEYCYNYFRRISPDDLVNDKDHAALQLGFYLASWGMYRGSSFLLQRTYKVHEPVVKVLAERMFKPLWQYEYGSSDKDTDMKSLIFEMVQKIKTTYRQFVDKKNSQQPTDTLVTKVILGTIGCLPACDRFFIDGFKSKEFHFSSFNNKFIERVGSFSREHLYDLREVQREIEAKSGVYYPLMKLVDMYFWQIGYEMSEAKRSSSLKLT